MASLSRKLVTPEGVPLNIKLGDMGARGGAFIVDMSIMFLLFLLSFYIAGKMIDFSDEDTLRGAFIFVLLAIFTIRNGYFLLFEATKRAATPGKMLVGLRVVSRDGGGLTLDQVAARNIMRELEIFLPLTALFAQSITAPGSVDSYAVLIGFLWTLIFMFFPLFNKDNLRVGDLLAGTWVVSVKKQKIQVDFAEQSFDRGNHYHFTREQLGIYGVFELQKLEEVLRRDDIEVMADVADTIAAKIGWKDHVDNPPEFLLAFYQALRTHLERGVLMGNRKADKFSA